MLFNSIAFAIFMPIVFILYWAIPNKYRWILLLVASYYFYMSWNVKYVFLIFLTTAVSYTCAILLEKEEDSKKKNAILAAACVICLGVLFFFKYFNFFSESITDFLNLFALQLSPFTLKLMLPVGISFYTFQTMSYVIDVYRGETKAEHHFGYYALFISFFPQLVAGPIERTNNLMPQIKSEHKFDYSKATYGIKQMAWGFFKKMVIADSLGKYVSLVYEDVNSFKGFSIVLATVFFSIQIYCDFSGYSDIAIGTAKLLGIDLMTNFKSPYFSRTIKEFWNRWHISLSTWLRDYIFNPLALKWNRKLATKPKNIRKKFKQLPSHAALFVTFLFSGLWHGASWTFVAWGGLHGVYQIVGDWTTPARRKAQKNLHLKNDNWILIFLQMLGTFIIVTISYIFFRANSFADAIYVFKNMFAGVGSLSSYVLKGIEDLNYRKTDMLFLGASFVMLAVFDFVSLKKDVIACISKYNRVVKSIIYVAFILWLVLNLPVNYDQQFIYFQF